MTQIANDSLIGYFDSSALVKNYLNETGTLWVKAWCANPDNVVALAEIGLVEIAAAFGGKLRGRIIRKNRYNLVIDELMQDAETELYLITVDRTVIDIAIELTKKHHLRGYDAVHLASALNITQSLIKYEAPSPIFISSDKALLTAATAEGLTVENPNNYT